MDKRPGEKKDDDGKPTRNVNDVLDNLRRQIASVTVPSSRGNVSFMEGQLEFNNQEHVEHLNELTERHKNEVENKSKEYENIITKLKDKLAITEELLAVNKGRLDECREAKVKLFEEQREMVKRYEDRLVELETCISDARVQLDVIDKDKDYYRLELEKHNNLEEVAKDLEEELEAVNEELEALKNDIKEKEEMIEKLEEDKKKLLDEMKAKEEANEELQKQLDEYINKFRNQEESGDSALAVLKDQLSKLEKEREALKNNLVDEKTRSSELESQIEQLRRDASLAKVEARVANRVKTDMERQLNEKTTQCETLLTDKETLVEEKTALLCQLEESEKTLELLQNEMREKEEDYSSLMSIKEVLREQKFAAEGDNLFLKEDVKKLKAALKDHDELKILLADKEEIIATKESEIKIKNKQIENLKKSVETLKTAITTLDDQLTSFEAVIQDKLSELENADKIRKLLENENQDIREQLRKAKIDLNEAKSLKSFTEKRLEITESTLRTQSETKESEVHAMMEKLAVATSRNEELCEETSSLMTQISTLEAESFELKKSLESYKTEKDRLNKDLSSCVKTIVDVKEENICLQKGLGEAITKAQSYKEKFLNAQEKLTKLEELMKVNEVTFSTTSEQQQKLIDHMADTLSNLYDKKKNKKISLFTPNRANKDSLFTPIKSSSTPVNRPKGGMFHSKVHPADPISIEQEKIILERLEQKRADLQTKLLDLQNNKGTPLTQKTPTLPIPKKVENILLKERSNTIIGATGKPAQGHAHKFHESRCNSIKKCMSCWEPVYKARPMSQCKDCRYTFHLACAVTAGDTCGLSENKAYEIQKDIFMMRSEPINNGTDDDVRGIVKVRTDKMQLAERRLLVIEGAKLKVYVNADDRKTAKPVAMYALNENTTVYFRIDATENQATLKNKIAFAMKVTFNTDQSDSEFMYMFHANKRQKRYWIQAIMKYTKLGGASSGETTLSPDCSFSSNDENKENQNQNVKLCEKLIVNESTNKVYVNCAQYLAASKTYLLGCDDGLYSAKSADGTPVKIDGPSSIYGIAILDAAKLAIFIEGPTRELTTVYSGLLKSCAEAAGCSNPKFATNAIAFTKDCYLFASRSLTFEDTVVAAAYSSGLLLCTMNKGELTVLKQFLIEDSITSLLMTPQSVFFGSNNVYELDTKTFETEEFLDSTDDAILYVKVINECYGSYPVAILDVTDIRGLETKEPEYLICFQDIGIFVDNFGRRSRDGDVLWSQVPVALEYHHPFLYIVHFHSIEVQKLDEKSYTKICKSKCRDKAKSQPESKVVMPEVRFLPVNSKSSPIYIGEGARGVVVALHEAKATKVMELFAS